MKKYLAVILILGIIAGVFGFYNQEKIYRLVYPSLCDSPIDFRMGSIDQKFNIEPKTFRKFTNDAANIWNNAYGEKIFQEDQQAKLTVHLVFDDRQRLTNEIGQLSTDISSSEKELKPSLAKHQQEVAAFQKKVDDFNTQVKYWNERGGAPEEEYQKLISEQTELQKQAEALNTRAKELNQSAVQFNSEISNYNTTVSRFNLTLKQRPEEGLFNGKDDTISIYFYISDPELIHTLAHEFGHALGMRHVTNPEGLMFSKTNQNTRLSQEDLAELSRVCLRMPIWEKLRGLYL